jgi:chemotaxis protein MotB
MKHLILIVSVSIFVSSCAPIYRCGEAAPEKRLRVSKRVMTVLNERDSLCTTLAQREQQIVTLENGLANEKSALQLLNTQYLNLQSKKVLEGEQFNEALRAKTDEIRAQANALNEKELLLEERERALNDMKRIIARQDSITNSLNGLIRNALLGFKSDELSVEIKNGKVYVSMSDKLLFRSGSAAVEAKGIDALRVLADVLNKNTDVDVLVEGHTDNLPIRTAQFRDNWDLSVARATSIVRTLIDDYKVLPTRLTASGKGEFLPRANNATPEGRAANRRTDIILSPKLDEILQLLK